MDPDEALKNARAAAAVIHEGTASYAERTEAAHDLADAFEALDDWLCSGGFKPSAWAGASEPVG